MYKNMKNPIKNVIIGKANPPPKKNPKVTLEVGWRVGPCLTLILLLENRPNIVIYEPSSTDMGGGVVYHVYFLYTLLKAVSHDDLSVLSMSAVGFQNGKFLYRGGSVG